MFEYKKIIDISLPLNEKTITYPGDPTIMIEPEMHDGKLLPRLSLVSVLIVAVI